jgi:hypothetical protein
MGRYAVTGVPRDENGGIITGATVTIYKADGTDAADVYEAESGGAAVNSVTTDANGRFTFYADDTTYAYSQEFKLVITKAGYTTITIDDVKAYGINTALAHAAQSNLLFVGYYAGIEAAVTAIGATVATLVVDENQSVADDLTIPATLGIEVKKGAVITVATTKTLTINGPFTAPVSQVFTLTGTGAVAGLKESYPQWFGAVADGATDDKAAIKAAFASVIAGGKVIIPKRAASYYFDNATDLTDAVAVTQAVTVQLDGTIISSNATNQADPPMIFNVTGAGFRLYGTGTLQGPGTFVVDETTHDNWPGLVKLAANNAVIDGINFVDPPESAIYIPNKDDIQIRNCKFTGGPLIAAATGNQYFAYIDAYGGDNHFITGNRFYATSAGVAIHAILYGSSTHATRLTIKGNQFDSMHQHCTYLTEVSNSVVSDNVIAYAQTETNQEGTALKVGGQYNTVTGNSIYNALKGVIICHAARHSVIAHNTIKSCGALGIAITNNVTETEGLDYNTIDSNVIEFKSGLDTSPYEGIRYAAYTAAGVTFAVDCVGGKITNNTVIRGGHDDDASYGGIGVYHSNVSYVMKDFDISGNKVITPAWTGIYAAYLSKSKISHNTIYNPVAATAHAIRVAACTYLTVEGNIARDDQTPAVIAVFLYLNGTDNNYIDCFNNGCFTTANTALLGFDMTYNCAGRGNRLSETDKLTGTFTMNNVNTLTIANDNISDATAADFKSSVIIWPLNQYAATAQGSAKHISVTGKVAKTSFTVTTADGNGVSANNHIFGFEIVQ